MQRLKQSQSKNKSKQHQSPHSPAPKKPINKRIIKQKRRNMSTTVQEKVTKVAQKRADAIAKRPYNAVKLLSFDGLHNDATFTATIDTVTANPFKYPAVGMTYHVLNSDTSDTYSLDNLPPQTNVDDDCGKDIPQLITVDFISQQQFNRGDLNVLFPALGLSSQKGLLNANKFSAKEDQTVLLLNPKTSQPALLVGLGDVIDGLSNTADADGHLTLSTFHSTVHTVTKHIKEKLQIPNVQINLPNLHLSRKIKNGYGAGNGIPTKDVFDPEKTPEQKAQDKAKPALPSEPPTNPKDIVPVEDIIASVLRAVTGANHTSDGHIDPETVVEDAIHLQSLFIKPSPGSQHKISSHRGTYNAVNLAESEILAREIGNEPSNFVTTHTMKAHCQTLAKAHPKTLTLKVWEEAELQELGHELIVSVGAASTNNPPRIAVLEYNNISPDAPQDNKASSIVGKTLVYDVGGLELKSWQHMIDMFYDKLGGVATLSILRSMALNRPIVDRKIVGALAIAENAIGSRATQPSSIFSEPNGKTVSVISPDAEGRLALASAMGLVQHQHNVGDIITMATLTGSVMVGLGSYAAGVFTNDNTKANTLIQRALKHDEFYWQMPVFSQHHKNVKGHLSDLVNCNTGPLSDASNAAAFLSHFLNKGTSFVHLDIAGVASLDEEQGSKPKGATGFGVHSVYDHVVTETNGKY